MRTLLLAAVFLCAPLATRGETIREWISKAPQADITFTPWDGDVADANGNRDGYKMLVQGFYGYVDLSRLPASAFPIKLRLLYNVPGPGDSVIDNPGQASQLDTRSPVGEEAAVDETQVPTPAEARALPVWSAPLSLRAKYGMTTMTESVRAEVMDHSDRVIGRLSIGASSTWWGSPRAILVNTPGGREAFSKGGYTSIGDVKRLVPESYAFIGIDAIWIDSSAATDPALTDSFWQQVLLNGTTVAGPVEDVSVLAQRLGLTVNQPGLPGRLEAAETPEAFIEHQGQLRPGSGFFVNVNGEANPFAFQTKVGTNMHRQLLSFSEAYLGMFLVLQTVVIVIAFTCLKGPRRVRLWFYVPCFAIGYTLTGIVLAHLAIPKRVEVFLPEVELIKQGWPQALLLTHLEEIRLAEHETVVKLPPGSRPFPNRSGYDPAAYGITYTFFHSPELARLTLQTLPATRLSVDTRSLLAAQPPCEATPDGKLRALRDFSTVWLWDGSQWRDLGPQQKGQISDWQSARIIHPMSSFHGRAFRDGLADEVFPAALKPLFVFNTAKEGQPVGLGLHGIFIGIGKAADVEIEDTSASEIATRRVVAYQFQLGANPP